MNKVGPILKTFIRDFVIIACGLGCLGSLLIAVIFHITAGIVTPADEFFTAIKQNNIEMAHGYLSKDFQANVSPAELDNYLTQTAIPDFKQVDWGSRFMEGERGGLVGGITTLSDDVVPIELSFVKEENGWKISSLKKSSSQKVHPNWLRNLLVWSAVMATLTTTTMVYKKTSNK